MSESGMAEEPKISVEAALGTIVVLAAASPVHRHTLFLGDIAWWALPPVQAGQFRLFQSQNRPVGAALWAKVSPEVGERLAEGGRVAVNEWQSGEQVWVVDLIAPYGRAQDMLTELATGTLKESGARYLSTRSDGTRVVNTLDDVAAKAASGSAG